LLGRYVGPENDLDRILDNHNNADNGGYNFSGNFVFRHRFKKRGRSLSLGVNTDASDRDGNSGLLSQDTQLGSGDVNVVNQQSDQVTNSFTVSPNLVYTEPIGKRGQFQLNYTPSYRKSGSDKRTSNFDPEKEDYTDLDTLLSNKFDNLYTTHRGGASYRFNNRKLNFNTSLNAQQSRLTSDQDFPRPFSVDRSFANVLPQLTANYKFSQSGNLRFMYRTSTNAPSVNQLQNVIDNRNPLFLRTGNPKLSQDYNHSVTLRYGKTNPGNSASLLLLVSGSLVQDYITNTSVIATSDTVVNDIDLTRGTQLSFPVNVNGYRSGRTLLTYGLPVKFIRSSMNFNTSFDYNRVPTLINGLRNISDNYGFSEGMVVASNISERLDFTLSYTAGYTIVRNSIQKQSDNNYFKQNSAFRVNWMLWKGLRFGTNVNYNQYFGLSEEFDQSVWLWNANLGYKLLKDQSLEVAINAFDILNRNKSFTRDVTETYIEDRETNVLTRYFMLVVTYRLSKFGG
jgi:hypothetical protein